LTYIKARRHRYAILVATHKEVADVAPGIPFRNRHDRGADAMNRIRSPQDIAAGLFLVAVAAVALWGGAKLSAGTLSQMGSGMLPRALAVLTGLCGIGLIAGAFFVPGAQLERWRLRGPLFVLGASIVFALTVRPLGLIVAAPAVVLISVLASSEARWVETLVFAAAMTVLCLGLFKYMLGLPIPVAPWLIGY
jgi:putative tricarboxylic transport membrane protein